LSALSFVSEPFSCIFCHAFVTHANLDETVLVDGNILALMISVGPTPLMNLHEITIDEYST
jgi:hypothetical protein